MLSNGVLNGPALGKYALNGGGFARELSGAAPAGVSHHSHVTVRRFASAVTAVAFGGRMITGITATTGAAVFVSGALTIRKITSGKAVASALASGVATRRVMARAVLTVALSSFGKAGYLSFRPTARRRISTIVEYRSTSITAEYRATAIHRETRTIVVPREAEK